MGQMTNSNLYGISPKGLVNLLLANGFEDAQSQHPDYAVLARPCGLDEEAVVVPIGSNVPHFFELMQSSVMKAMRLLTAEHAPEEPSHVRV
jgi:hypothetical protein